MHENGRKVYKLRGFLMAMERIRYGYVKLRTDDLLLIKNFLIPQLIKMFPELEGVRISYARAVHLLLKGWKGEIKL